jgi:hypothetical protein
MFLKGDLPKEFSVNLTPNLVTHMHKKTKMGELKVKLDLEDLVSLLLFLLGTLMVRR